MSEAEIIAVGNELLQGDVQDTNTHWLCRRLSDRGVRVQRGALVPDDGQVIAEAVHQSLSRRPKLLILTGGLGPTADDLTVASVADALDRALQLNPEALAMVEETYREFEERGLVQTAHLTKERRKMAYLPRGAEPLANAVGAAPGVLLWSDDTAIVCLPGVPEELQSIFEQSLSVRLQHLYGEHAFLERILVTDCGDESQLAPIVDTVAERHPDVYVKSRAKPYGEGVQLHITLSARGTDAQTVRHVLDDAGEDLKQRLSDAGIGVLEELTRDAS